MITRRRLESFIPFDTDFACKLFFSVCIGYSPKFERLFINEDEGGTFRLLLAGAAGGGGRVGGGWFVFLTVVEDGRAAASGSTSFRCIAAVVTAGGDEEVFGVFWDDAGGAGGGGGVGDWDASAPKFAVATKNGDAGFGSEELLARCVVFMEVAVVGPSRT